MEAYSKKILLHPREYLEPCSIDQWPVPKRHRYYQLELHSCFDAQNHPNDLTNNLCALDFARQRPDIDFLHVWVYSLKYEAFRSKMEELLNQSDRIWLVCVDCTWYYKLEDLTRALAVFRNVQFLALDYALDFKLLDQLPPFNKLQWLGVGAVVRDVKQLDRLVSYPFAPQLDVIVLCDECGHSPSAPILSQDTLQHVHSFAVGYYPTFKEEVANEVTIVQAMPNLHRLSVLMCGKHQPDYTHFTTLLRWLGNPQCPVTDLSVYIVDPECIPDILAVIPQIPLLKSLWLYHIRGVRHYWEDLLPCLRASPLLESIFHRGWDHGCNGGEFFSGPEILEFQLASRPRLFTIQVVKERRGDRSSLEPFDSPNANNVHYLSIMFQRLQRFRRSKNLTTFPLSVWAIVLEKLSTEAFDEPLARVVAAGTDAQFSVIRELFERPHELEGGRSLQGRHVVTQPSNL